MWKCANYSPYMRRPLVIYDFATAPFWISLYIYEENLIFFFINVDMTFTNTIRYCRSRRLSGRDLTFTSIVTLIKKTIWYRELTLLSLFCRSRWLSGRYLKFTHHYQVATWHWERCAVHCNWRAGENPI